MVSCCHVVSDVCKVNDMGCLYCKIMRTFVCVSNFVNKDEL